MAVYALPQIEALTLAILKAVGIPADEVSGLTYVHDVGEIPRLTVRSAVWNADTSAFDHIVTDWTPTPKESDVPHL
jgi:hypothetical protein